MSWMYSCERVAELLSQRLDEPLGLIGELQLRVHLRMCGNCSNVADQVNAVHSASADLFCGPYDEDEPDSLGAPR